MRSDFSLSLEKYQLEFEKTARSRLHEFGDSSKLLEACEYALTNGGKRFRPALVLMVADAVGKGGDASYASLAIEFFHTASLIADDLPCMDDDDERRSKPSLHLAYGESTALLASYVLISAGYECLAKNAEVVKNSGLSYSSQSDKICVEALQNVSYNTGLHGASGGQFLDISPPDFSQSTIKDIIQKKTGSLFEVAFVLGWLFGGGSLDQIYFVKRAAAHFGMAFQIADDIGDREQDIANGRKVNMANLYGLEDCLRMIEEETDGFQHVLKQLRIDHSALAALPKLLQSQIT